MSLFLFTILLFNSCSCFYPRYEYLSSFSRPRILANGKNRIQFFSHEGDVILDDHLIRLNPSLPHHKGLVYSDKSSSYGNWEVVMDLKVSGNHRVGGEGIAFWYTKDQPKLGTVYGANDRWHGMEIFFDSFDNDKKGNNPQIILVMNDGKMSYNHNNDGNGQIIAGCHVDYRNSPFPFRVHIRFKDNKVSLWYNAGVINLPGPSEEVPLEDTSKGLSKYGLLCFNSENLNLPKEGYFGISGMSGQLGDDHDVSSFLVYSLHAEKPPNHEVDEQKLKEKQEYDRNFEHHDEEIDDEPEDIYSRSLHVIYSLQHDILERINKIDQDYPIGLFKTQVDKMFEILRDIKKSNTYNDFDPSNRNKHPLHEINKQLAHLQYNMDVLVYDHQHGLATCIQPWTLLIVVAIQLAVGVGIVIYFLRRESNNNRKLF